MGFFEGKEGVVCDYMACVIMCTKAFVDEMLILGIFVVMMLIVVGLFVGVKCLGGFFVGFILFGFMFVVMMFNVGGVWDNFKKYIENEKVYGGKKFDMYKVCVVGDIVGDFFKDIFGLVLNIFIKFMIIFFLIMVFVFRFDWKTYWYGFIVFVVEIIFVGVVYYYVWVVNGEKCVLLEEKK